MDVLTNRARYAERIFGSSHPEPNSGCWIWTSFVWPNGYARIKVATKKYMRANRVSYMAYHGAIPEGMYVCHRCDTRSCVNPDHLWLGTPLENTQDMMLKGRACHNVTVKGRNPRAGELNPKAKLSELQVREIRGSELSQRKLADLYGVTRSCIQSVCNFRNWKDVT